MANLLYEVDKKKCEEEFKRYFEKNIIIESYY
jgi:hypothetical protein